jgi:hypothetical protein
MNGFSRDPSLNKNHLCSSMTPLHNILLLRIAYRMHGFWRDPSLNKNHLCNSMTPLHNILLLRIAYRMHGFWRDPSLNKNHLGNSMTPLHNMIQLSCFVRWALGFAQDQRLKELGQGQARGRQQARECFSSLFSCLKELLPDTSEYTDTSEATDTNACLTQADL